MQTAILNVIPAAAAAAPARGIGSAARAGGPSDADAAAGAFAGLLAAATPPTESAAMPLVAAAALNVDDAATVDADGDIADLGAAGSLPLADAPVDLPEADDAGPGVAVAGTTPAATAAAAVPGEPMSPEAATSMAAIPVATTETTTPAAAPTAMDVPAPTAAAVIAAAPETASPATSPTATDVLAREQASQDIAGAPTATAAPAAAADAAAPTAAVLPSGTPAAVADQPMVILTAGEATEAELSKPAITPEPDAVAPEARHAGNEAESGDDSTRMTGITEANEADESAETQDLPATADAKPAALQALLGLGLQTYLKAEAFAGQRPPAMTAGDPAANGGAGDARAEGQVLTGRPAAFAAAVDSALAGLSGGGDNSSEDALMALTGAGRTRTARGADAASTIRSQVAEQVARGLASNRGEDKLTIRLNPESLGQVDVDFSSTGDRLTVVMRASTPEAEQALRAGARELTDGILERAARFQHVEVRVELRDGPAARTARQDERQQDERHDRQDKGQDGKQDGRRDGRADGRGRHPDGMFDGAKSAWARAMADLTQED